MMTYEPGDVIEVPFPFIESGNQKLRPALVISKRKFQEESGACILVMITSAERSHWPSDVFISDWAQAGLKKPSLIRWKVFTLEETLIKDKRGSLTTTDFKTISQTQKNIFQF